MRCAASGAEPKPHQACPIPEVTLRISRITLACSPLNGRPDLCNVFQQIAAPLQWHGPLTHAPYQPRNPTRKVQTGSMSGGHEGRERSSTGTGAQPISSPHMSLSITALLACAIGKSMLQQSKRCSVDQPDEPLFPGPAISMLADSDQKLLYNIVELSDPLKPA